jgi:hypothetical protein
VNFVDANGYTRSPVERDDRLVELRAKYPADRNDSGGSAR